MIYSRQDLIELLMQSHAALEAVTDRVGCSFETAVILCDCENALKQIYDAEGKQKGRYKAGDLIHVH